AATAAQFADLGSQLELPDGSTGLGPPDGRPDLVVAYSGVPTPPVPTILGPEVVVYPALFNDQGQFLGLGSRQTLTNAVAGPLDVDVGDINKDGLPDAVVVDRDGIVVVFGQPPTIVPNDTPQTARRLGTVVHLVEPTLTIVPGHEDAFFTLKVPD